MYQNLGGIKGLGLSSFRLKHKCLVKSIENREKFTIRPNLGAKQLSQKQLSFVIFVEPRMSGTETS